MLVVFYADFVKNADQKTKENLAKDRKSRIELENTGIFDNKKFNLVCDQKRFKIFKEE